MRTMIGIVGRKRSGKDTLANFATEILGDARVLSFAEPLKQACKHAYNLRDEQLDETKDEIDKRWGMTPRDMMKTLGVDYFRSKDPSQWTKNMGFRIEGAVSRPETAVVISDVRFQNEAAFVRENGGVLIHVSRDLPSNSDDHESEKTTDEIVCDHYINNNGSLRDLKNKLRVAIEIMSDQDRHASHGDHTLED